MLRRLWLWAWRDLAGWRNDWPEWLIVGGILLTVAIAALGCASAPKVGLCAVTACGIECCNNDGKRCPPCWEVSE